MEMACQRWADRNAITYRGQSITYAQLWDQVAALATAYRRLGVQAGDRVLCGLRNCPEHIVAINAAWACGAVHVGVDDDLTAPELARLVDHIEPATVLFHPRGEGTRALEPLRSLSRSHPSVVRVLHETEPEGDEVSLTALLQDGLDDEASASPRLEDDDTALIFLTSGTTGRPKGVMETAPVCWAKMQFFADAFRPGVSDVHLVYLPISHVFGLRLALLALLRGGRVVLQERFSSKQALDLVGDERVTVLPGMPTHLTLLLSNFDPSRHEVESLRWIVSAAAGLPRPLVEAVYERFGTELLYVFGCSEGFTTQTTDRHEILRGSVGRTVFRGPPGTPANGAVAIMSPDSQTLLPPGDIGEIVFGAATPVRYWREPDVATDGWYRTGDLGRMDPDGCLYVLGRLKELVNRGGLKVSPAEVEAVLLRHPRVADAAIVAAPDPVLGEATCACLVPSDGQPPDLAEVRAFLGPTLARHKLPDELCLLEQIPRSPIGKVDRPRLRKAVVDADAPRERLRPR
ncbi:MAG: acyl--CoA ligase [Actinomycetota bacterium]|nr:acyl--CoA ligase [Actinomycetota bacterium]